MMVHIKLKQKNFQAWCKIMFEYIFEMVDLYSDLSSSESFAKYFGAEGIKKVENKSLNDL